MRRGIVIPTFNECNNIAPLVQEILRYDDTLRILVVDDNSPDGTGQVVERLCRDHPGRVYLVSREYKMGLGSAYVEGFTRALEEGWDLICEMDADRSHQPSYLEELFHWSRIYPLVMGSRYIPEGCVQNWNPCRRMLSRGGNLYARLVLGVPVRDLTSGFRCYHRKVLESMDLAHVRSNGYAFQIETAYRAHLLGFPIKEFPIVFVERTQGNSKISRDIVLEAVLMVWKLRFQRKRILHAMQRSMKAKAREPGSRVAASRAHRVFAPVKKP